MAKNEQGQEQIYRWLFDRLSIVRLSVDDMLPQSCTGALLYLQSEPLGEFFINYISMITLGT